MVEHLSHYNHKFYVNYITFPELLLLKTRLNQTSVKGHRDICFKIEKQNATCQMPRVPRETEGIFVFRQCYEKFQCCILREVQPGAERTTRLELPVLFLPELYQTNLRAHGPHYQTASSLL